MLVNQSRRVYTKAFGGKRKDCIVTWCVKPTNMNESKFNIGQDEESSPLKESDNFLWVEVGYERSRTK